VAAALLLVDEPKRLRSSIFMNLNWESSSYLVNKAFTGAEVLSSIDTQRRTPLADIRDESGAKRGVKASLKMISAYSIALVMAGHVKKPCLSHTNSIAMVQRSSTYQS
jgi:hypothetical protein